jgi:pyruvate/2-oxoacid:ferredoxin oxidoreductase beta subunit
MAEHRKPTRPMSNTHNACPACGNTIPAKVMGESFGEASFRAARGMRPEIHCPHCKVRLDGGLDYWFTCGFACGI